MLRGGQNLPHTLAEGLISCVNNLKKKKTRAPNLQRSFYFIFLCCSFFLNRKASLFVCLGGVDCAGHWWGNDALGVPRRSLSPPGQRRKIVSVGLSCHKRLWLLWAVASGLDLWRTESGTSWLQIEHLSVFLWSNHTTAWGQYVRAPCMKFEVAEGGCWDLLTLQPELQETRRSLQLR